MQLKSENFYWDILKIFPSFPPFGKKKKKNTRSMFTLKLLRNSLLSGVNSSRIASSRSISLFRKPKEEKAKKEEEELGFEEPPIEKFSFPEDEESFDPELEEQRIERMRNKSRLRDPHWKMLHDLRPYDRAESWIHNTIKYKRMLYGKLGAESGVDPRICFYTEAELAEKEAYNKVAYPHTIPEMMKMNEQFKAFKQQKIREREEQVAKNLEKLKQWQNDFITKKNKREEEGKF